MLHVLGLVKTVGKEENRSAGVNADFLLRELEIGKEPNRQVGIARQLTYVTAYEQRSIVTGIAVGE